MIHFPLSNGFSQGALRYFVNNSLQSCISLTSSGYYDNNENYNPNKLLTFSNFYASEANSNFGQWVQMEFKEHKLDLEGYSMYSTTTADRARNWRFSVSSDGSDWTDIHIKSNEDINGGKVFDASASNIRFFRWTQTAANNGIYNYMVIDQVDVFGNFSHINFAYTPSFSPQFLHVKSLQCTFSLIFISFRFIIILNFNFIA